MAHALDQLLVAQQTGPRTDGLAVAVQNADDRKGEIPNGFRIDIDVGPWDGSCLGDFDIREIRGSPRTNGWFRHVKGQRRISCHDLLFSSGEN